MADADPTPDPPPPTRSPAQEHDHDLGLGLALVKVAWWGTAIFTLVAVAATAAPATFGGAALVLDVVLFAAGCVLFTLAFLRAVDRSRTDAIGIGGLFFLAGDVAPPAVRRHLVGALAVQTAVGLVTAGLRLYTNLAAGILVPVFGLGLCGLWAARYGHFERRMLPPPRSASRRSPSAAPPDADPDASDALDDLSPKANRIGGLTITDALLRDLAGFTSERAPVTSCYLDVDGRRFIRPQDLEPHLDDLLRKGRRRMATLNGDGNGNGDRSALASVEADLRRISDFVRGGIDRSSTRGLAMFSCSADGFWQVVELAVAVPNVIVVNATPHIRVLESVVDQYLRFAVLLVDRQRARILLFEQGKLIDKQEHFDQLPRHDDDGGQMDRDHLAGHAEAVAAHHLRRAAQAAFAVYQEQAVRPPDPRAPPDAIARDMERELHPWLRERIAARLSIPVAARDADITQAALEVEAGVERAREAALVERLRQAVGARQRSGGRPRRRAGRPRRAPGGDAAGVRGLRGARVAVPFVPLRRGAGSEMPGVLGRHAPGRRRGRGRGRGGAQPVVPAGHVPRQPRPRRPRPHRRPPALLMIRRR